MLGRLNHVALAVPDLEKACAQYRQMLGANLSAPQALPEFTPLELSLGLIVAAGLQQRGGKRLPNRIVPIWWLGVGKRVL